MIKVVLIARLSLISDMNGGPEIESLRASPLRGVHKDWSVSKFAIDFREERSAKWTTPCRSFKGAK